MRVLMLLFVMLSAGSLEAAQPRIGAIPLENKEVRFPLSSLFAPIYEFGSKHAVIISDRIMTDGFDVFDDCNLIVDADPATFKIIDNNFSHDRKNVYLDGIAIPDSDGSTAQYWKNLFGGDTVIKDSKHTYKWSFSGGFYIDDFRMDEPRQDAGNCQPHPDEPALYDFCIKRATRTCDSEKMHALYQKLTQAHKP